MNILTPFEDGALAKDGNGPYPPETLLSEAYSRRFVGTPRDASIAPYLVITDYYAVVNTGTEEEPYITLQNITETAYCTDWQDVGGTEVDRDYTYDDEFERYSTVEHAEREAIRHLEGWDLSFWRENFR
jgi:hypothetical protein